MFLLHSFWLFFLVVVLFQPGFLAFFLSEIDQRSDTKFRQVFTEGPAAAKMGVVRASACSLAEEVEQAGSLCGVRVGVSRGRARGVASVACPLLRWSCVQRAFIGPLLLPTLWFCSPGSSKLAVGLFGFFFLNLFVSFCPEFALTAHACSYF